MTLLINPYAFGTSSTWDPGDLAGIAIWLRADDIGQADASAVASWVDRIGSYDFAQSAAGQKPTFYTSTSARLINGQPTVSFDGTDDLLRYAGIVGTPTSGHVIVVCQITVPAVAAATSLFSSADESTTLYYWSQSLYRPTSDTLITVQQKNNDTQDLIDGTTTALTTGTDYVLEAASSGTAYTLRVNGTSQTKNAVSGADTGDWFGDTPNRDSLVVGALKRSSEVQFVAADIAEVIVVNDSTISAGDRSSLNSYLTSRYGITMA